jgi:hypothetical protein
MIDLVDPSPPVPPAELDAAERRLAELGHPIPASYRAFLTEQDGGRPVRDRFSFEQDNQPQRDAVKAFLGVRPPASPRATNLVRTARILGDRVPYGVLPIAKDHVGNLICLDGRDGRDGPVYFWDHEYEGEPPDEANLYEIAPDLPTFLDMLREKPARPTPARRRGRLQRLLSRR